MPTNFTAIIGAQALVFFGFLVLNWKPRKWSVFFWISIWLAVVLGVLFDMTLGSAGIFAYFPVDGLAESVQPQKLSVRTILINAVASYGLAVCTVALIAEKLVGFSHDVKRSRFVMLGLLTVGILGTAYAPRGSMPMMFAWGLIIISIGEISLLSGQKAGPIVIFLEKINPYPLLLLWGASVVIGLAYEGTNWFFPFWEWLPDSEHPKALVVLPVVFLGYFVLCHPIAIFWFSIRTIIERKSSAHSEFDLPLKPFGFSSREPEVGVALNGDGSARSDQYYNTLKEYCDFQWNALSSTLDVLLKAATIYLLIFGALTGFMFSNAAAIPDFLRPRVIEAGLWISFFVSIAGLALVVGYLLGLRSLKATFRKLNEQAFRDANLESFMDRGIAAVILAGISAAASVVLFAILLWSLYQSS